MEIERTGLVKYDAMQRAIIAASAVDEVKDIRDKALALQKYAQQARNFDAEQRAARIRIHAELKGGQLLKAAQKAKGARLNGRDKGGKHRASQPASTEKTLKQLGVSETQSSRWQQLAENPKAVEKYLQETDGVPTTAGALVAAQSQKRAASEPPLPFSDESLWLSGRLRDIDERKIDPAAITDGADAQIKTELRTRLDAVLPTLTKLRGLL